MGQKKVIETDGLAGINAGAVQGGNNSVLDTEQYAAPANRNVQRSRVAKDYIDDQKVFENDELAPAWPQTRDVRRSTPESA